MNAGLLVSDEIVNAIVESQVKAHKDSVKGFIFDGYPRTVAQAETLDGVMDAIGAPINLTLFLEVEKDELVERLLKRAIDSGRKDDNKETIEKRVVEYREKTLPVASHYDAQGKVRKINGLGSIEEIRDRLFDAIDQELINIQ